MTTTRNANAVFKGISRMEDAEPAIPFTTAATAATTATTAAHGSSSSYNGESTPRPSSNQSEKLEKLYNQRKEWQIKFEIAAKTAAKQTKHRRSLKTTTNYIPSTSPLFKKGITALEMRCVTRAASELIDEAEFAIIKQELTKHRILLEVNDVTTLDQLHEDLREAKENTSIAESTTIAAFTQAIADATASGLQNPETIAKANPVYLSALQEFNEKKYWVDALSREITRCTQSPFQRSPFPISPTQHARIAPSSRSVLSNILTHETCTRKFISLGLLTKQIGNEFAEFFSNSDRCLDRKHAASALARKA
jgi:hypothetical protein